MNKLSPLALALGLICTHSAIAEEGFRQHDAHVHGEVEFNIAQDGNELLIEITAPGSDVVGFEHAPETQQQSKTLEQAITQLNKATTLFTINQSAQCKIEHASVRHTLSEDEHHDHDHHADDSHHHQAEHDENHHEHEQHSNHGEFTIEYHYQCADLAKLEQIDTQWFKLFSATEKIRINLLTDTKQTALELHQPQSKIAL